MERGALRWAITLPEQGGMPFDGIGPSLIQWQAEPHPAAALPESGCTLIGLEGWHAQAGAAEELLQTIGFENEFSVAIHHGDSPGLAAHILTPAGMRTLG
jgi:hypothetical protein